MIALSVAADRPLSPAQKAWVTRRARAQGLAPLPAARRQPDTAAAKALAAYEAAIAAGDANGMPDWEAAARALRAALIRATETPATSARGIVPTRATARPKAIAAPVWPDYPVDKARSFDVRNPTILVTFADGEAVRCPAVSLKGKVTNIGRGLRVAIAFYHSRACRKMHVPDAPGCRPAVPEIVRCLELGADGETVVREFDAVECTARTVQARAAQDWRLRHG